MTRTVRDLLAEHEATLVSRLNALRAEIIPLERELAEVRRARSAVAMVDYGPEQQRLTFGEKDSEASTPSVGINRPQFVSPRSPYVHLTIKQLVLKALSEQFERGATSNELLEFFANGFGRQEIARTSLSPQLSRLKQEGEIILIGQRWSLPTAHTREADHGSDSQDKAATSQ